MIQHADALELAFEYYGIKELPGKKNNNPEILGFFEDCGHAWVRNDEYAWCAAFLNSILVRAGYYHTGALNARSFLDIGEEVTCPELGDIVVFWRLNKVGPYGHVGFYMGENKKSVYCLGGNQSNSVKISPYEQDRVLKYIRIKKIIL